MFSSTYLADTWSIMIGSLKRQVLVLLNLMVTSDAHRDNRKRPSNKAILIRDTALGTI